MTFKPIYFKIILLVFLIHLIFVPTFGSQNLIENPFQNFNAGKGDYFGEEPPGLLPKVFSPSLVDPKIHHLHRILSCRHSFLKVVNSVVNLYSFHFRIITPVRE